MQDILALLKHDKEYVKYKQSLEIQREKISSQQITDLYHFMIAWALSSIFLLYLYPNSTIAITFVISTVIIAHSHTYHMLNKGHTHYKVHDYYLKKYVRDKYLKEIP